MGRNHKFAVGVTVALMLGAAASPALATPDNGHAYGKAPATKPAKPVHPPKPDHPAKGPKAKPGHLSGGGTSFNGVGFSVQGRSDKLKQAHFNYGDDNETSDSSAPAAPPATPPVKVRCRPFTDFQRTGTSVTVTANCVASGPFGDKVPSTLTATFTDNGHSGDVANISVVRTSDSSSLVSDNGAIKSGNIKVHP